MSKSPNSKIKHEYKQYAQESQGKSDKTMNSIRYAINTFEEFTDFADFKKFNKEIAIDFKRNLLEKTSKANARRVLINLKDFFKWLSCQSGFKRSFKVHDVDYFNLSLKEEMQAKANVYKPFSTCDEIKTVIFSIPTETEIKKRNQALIAFTLLTAIRIEAIISLKLKHINLEKDLVIQTGEVKTKFSKTIHTFFFPVGDDVKQIVIDWIDFLKTQKGFTDNDPLFPKNQMEVRDFSFVCTGLSKEHWQQTTQARKIFKDAFANAGVKCYNPHSFRRSLVHLGETVCTTAESFKAWSQNLGHENVGTTFTSYGVVSIERQGEIIKGGGKVNNNANELTKDDLIKMLEMRLN